MVQKVQRDWSQPFFEGICPREIDWARLAAYIDGEGSILINTQVRRRDGLPRFYLRIMVANTDVRLMIWLKEHFGGTYVNANTAKYYEGKNYKQCYHWGCSSSRAAWILHNCMQWFVMKAEQAELGIQLQASLKEPRGRELSPETVAARLSIKRRLLVMKARGLKLEPSQEKRIADCS